MPAKPFYRWSGASVAASAVTALLMLTMAQMIAAEFQPQDKLEARQFEINPVIEDIPPAVSAREIKSYEQVETPPPPPKTGFDPIEKVKVAPAVITGDSGAIDPPVIKIAMLGSLNIDRDYQPQVRIPPVMPPRADRSGHCEMRFDVSAEGQPFNIEAASCSQRIFARASVKSVQKWKYLPRYQDGRAVGATGLKTRITFDLRDENGVIIPE